MTVGRRVNERIRLVDALVLIAALAVGLTLSRNVDSGGWTWTVEYSEDGGHVATQKALGRFALFGRDTLLGLVPISLILPALEWYRSGTTRTELFQRPGFTACLAVGVAVALNLLRSLAIRWTPAAPPILGWTDPWFDDGEAASAAVASCWGLLWMGGTWRAVPTWRDRFGRLLGLIWIVGPLAANVAATR